MRLAICVVYVVHPGSEWLLRLHLAQIARTTAGDFRVLAAVPRVSEAGRAILAECPFVEVLDLPPAGTCGSAEHAHYLDHLVAEADRGGATHFATLDVDSFPVRRGWAPGLAARLTPARPFAAVLRAENGDRALPHPSGILARMDFWRAARPPFLPSRRDYFGRSPLFVLRWRQRRDTGIGLALAVWRQGGDWLRLTRTNGRDEHRIMAGIYGGTFFHLGAMSREPMFECDWWDDARGRLYWHTRRLGLFAAGRAARDRAILDRNGAIRDRIVAALQADPDGYLASLGGASA